MKAGLASRVFIHVEKRKITEVTKMADKTSGSMRAHNVNSKDTIIGFPYIKNRVRFSFRSFRKPTLHSL